MGCELSHISKGTSAASCTLLYTIVHVRVHVLHACIHKYSDNTVYLLHVDAVACVTWSLRLARYSS